MKKILIVAATQKEVEYLIDLPQNINNQEIERIDFLITGIGIVNTIHNLTDLLKDVEYNLVINIGICGAYNRELELGQVVEVIEDCFADQLVETGSQELKWFEAGFNSNTVFPYTENGKLLPSHSISLSELNKVKSITSDTVHASEQSISKISQLFAPDIETMEGAAVFYVCRKMNIDVIQIRSISNYVEIRNKKEWKIEMAIENLTPFVKTILLK